MNLVMEFSQFGEEDTRRSLLFKINERFFLADRIIDAIETVSLFRFLRDQ